MNKKLYDLMFFCQKNHVILFLLRQASIARVLCLSSLFCLSACNSWIEEDPQSEITDEKVGAGCGRIALQIHDGGGIKVRWRNLHLKTL